MVLLLNMESPQLMIWLMKYTQLVLILRKQTISYGHSSLEDQEEDFLKKDILSKEEEIGEIDKFLSTILSRECYDILINI